MNSLLGNSFSAFGRTIGIALPIQLATSIPAFLYVIYFFSGIDQVPLLELVSKLTWFGFTLVAIGMFVGPITTAAITYAVVQSETATPVSAGEALRVGVGRLGAVLGTALLTGLAIIGGLLLLIVPGVIAAVRLSAAPAVATVERLGPIASLKRSWQLTEGFGGQIFGAFFVVGIIGWVAGFVGEKALIPAAGAPIADILSGIKTNYYLQHFAGVFTGALTAVIAAMVYVQARRAKEGVDAAALAATFD